MKALKQNGFTLVELMIVIVIVGILAAVAIPKFSAASDKAKASECPTMLSAIFQSEETYKADNGVYPATLVILNAANTDQLPLTTAWFEYSSVSAAPFSTFTGMGKVKVAFGKTTPADNATIKEDGTKLVTGAELKKLIPAWK